MASAKKDIDRSLISDVRAFLVSAPKGVSLNRFDREYRSLFGRSFPFRAYGYSSTLNLLRALEPRGVLQIRRSNNPKDGGWLMYGIPDTDKYTPSWVMKAHDKHSADCNTSYRRGRSLHRPHSVCSSVDGYDIRSQSPGDILSDSGDTFSVCVQWKKLSSAVLSVETVLSELMSKVGTPIEIIYADKRNFAFVHYGSHAEAERALTLNYKTVNKYVFTIRPAVSLKGLETTNSSSVKATTFKDTRSGITPHVPSTSPWEPLSNNHRTNEHHHPITPAGMEPSFINYCSSDEGDSSELSDSEWDELLSNSVTKIHWSRLVVQFNGGISWSERLTRVCGEDVAVELIAIQPVMHTGCTHWLRQPNDNSHEMICFKSLQSYAFSVFHSMPACTQSIGEVYCFIDKGSVSRCVLLEGSSTTRPAALQVFNIDTGETILTDLSSLKTPPRWFCDFPMMILPCCLQDSSLKHFKGTASVSLSRTNDVTTSLPLPLVVKLPCGGGPPPLIQSTTVIQYQQHPLHNPVATMTTPTTVKQHSLQNPSAMTTPTTVKPSATMTTPTTVKQHHSLQNPSATGTTPTTIVQQQHPLSLHNHPAVAVTSPTTSTTDLFSSSSSCSSPPPPLIDPLLDRVWRFNDACNNNGLVAVFVSEVITPGLFWLQITSDPVKDLHWMSERIKQYVYTQQKASSSSTGISTQYTRQLHSNTQVVHKGSVYAYNREETCYRVRVEAVPDYYQRQAVVVCIDSGMTINQVCVSSLQTLPPFLALKPPLAIPCRMSGIRSTRGDGLWWRLDSQLLWRTIRHKTVYVRYPVEFTSVTWTDRGLMDELVSIRDVFLDPKGETSVNSILLQEGDSVTATV